MKVGTIAICLTALLFGQAASHGRLRVPPSRSSMWRDGFYNPPNYDDNELYCGGFTRQWVTNGGNCGVCGDPWDLPQPRENEAGGKYGNGIIVRNYQPGSVIDVKVEMTQTHRGYFEFRLCVNNDVTKIITHECLDQNLLQLADGSGTRFQVGDAPPGEFNIQLKLPNDLTCSHCVLQWKANNGNSWGTDPDGTNCLGCGPQEQFHGCSDISINAVHAQSQREQWHMNRH